MPTLQIEHSINDFTTWKTAFDRFAGARERTGVRRHHVQRRADDPNYLVIDLDFDTMPEAQAFLGFLQANVWSSPASAPALVGTPQARILEPAESP
jgi:hypothetical protein